MTVLNLNAETQMEILNRLRVGLYIGMHDGTQ